MVTGSKRMSSLGVSLITFTLRVGFQIQPLGSFSVLPRAAQTELFHRVGNAPRGSGIRAYFFHRRAGRCPRGEARQKASVVPARSIVVPCRFHF